jgi:hypothetical protein
MTAREHTTDDAGDIFEGDPTDVTARPGAVVDERSESPHSIEQATPTEVTASAEHSQPLRVISMKDQTEAEHARMASAPLHVQLRSLAEISRRPQDTPIGLGRLAPPRDPREARARRVRANLWWAAVAIALACAIMLAIWLVAGR